MIRDALLDLHRVQMHDNNSDVVLNVVCYQIQYSRKAQAWHSLLKNKFMLVF